LEDTWFVAAFHSTPMHDPGLKEVQRPARVCVCKGQVPWGNVERNAEVTKLMAEHRWYVPGE